MYKKRTEEAKKDYLQQIAVYRASLVSSSSDPTLYIQTNFMSRSPTLQIPNYNSRQIYSSIANQAQHQHQHHHQHNHKTLNHHSGHTGNHASPLRLVQETDCMQLAPLLTDVSIVTTVVILVFYLRINCEVLLGVWNSVAWVAVTFLSQSVRAASARLGTGEYHCT